MSEHDAKPAKRAPAYDPRPIGKRVAPFPTSVVLDEEIVNSSRVVPLVAPRVIGLPGRAIVSVKPATALVSRRNDLEKAAFDMAKHKAEAFSPAEPTHTVADGVDIPIRFWPTFSGTHEADISILLRGDDDDVELRTMRVYAHARRLDEAPEHPLGETRTPSRPGSYEEVPVADPEGVSRYDEKKLEEDAEFAAIEARGVANHQKDGVAEVHDEVKSYVRRPPEPSLMEAAAELALSLTVAGVAAGVAKAFTGAALKTQTVRRIAPHVSKAESTSVALGDFVKEGLKRAGAAAFLHGASKVRKDVSTNTEIAFFSMQREATTRLGTENELVVANEKRRLGHVLRTDPEAAIASMQMFRAGLKAMVESASATQAHHTRREWLSVVAKSNNGIDFAKVNGELRQTTNLHHATSSVRGVLRITVEDRKVTKASIDGVSQAAAAHLLDRTLLREPIPLLIEVRTERGGSFYTRDEVGRVRAPFVQEGEESRHHHAQRTVDEVLSKSLSAWGVTRIETDDQNKEPGQ